MRPEYLTPQLKRLGKAIPNRNGLHIHPSPDLPFFGNSFFDPEGQTCLKQGWVVFVDRSECVY
jgi:hypothetical protein